jgi:Raf kinase inhibitor-like YbhB/YbcL family protein
MDYCPRMRRSTLGISFAFALATAALPLGCSSSGGGGNPGTGGSTSATGGTTATGGSGTGGTATGGNLGTGGGTGGAATGGSGGTTSTGGSGGHGGAAGGAAGSAGGSSGGSGGAGGHGGAAGGTGGKAGNGGGGGPGGSGAGLSLTSTAFTEGMTIPAAQTCTGNSNMSPPLTWTAGPSATMSYGLALHDMTNDAVHWVIWDIPATTTSLPGNLPTTQMLTTPVMAQQHNTFGSDGYYGPCPMGSTHTYVFEVYALDVAKLPSVTATTATKTIRMTMMTHQLATGTLSGTSNASR